ncbi:MAG: hypothetical protein HHAS10_03990 [Candidatus Altimarinota bacterium]
MDIINILAGIIGGSLATTIINHFLNRSNTIADRNYLFLKEKFFKYQTISEKLIQKLILVDNHRETLIKYVQNSQIESVSKGSKFINLTDSFNKDLFEQNQHEIATIIFIYFPEIIEDWNKCLDLMEKLYGTALIIPFSKQHGIDIDWKKLIDDFNEINIKIGDLPNKISTKIKDEVKDLETEISNQKSKFKFL